jgi:hypothetical protein
MKIFSFTLKTSSLFGLMFFLFACSENKVDETELPEITENEPTVTSVDVSLIPDSIPPAFDSSAYHMLTVDCFHYLGYKTGGQTYFSNTADSVAHVIRTILVEHAQANSDIMFVIDNTGSMTDDIDNLKTNLNIIIEELKQLQNVRVGVATYGDKNVDGNKWFEYIGLSQDLEKTKQFINGISVTGGGDFPESAYDALVKTVNKTKWDASGKRMILLLGDAPSLEPPLSDHDKNDVVKACRKNNVKANIYPVLINIWAPSE